MVYCDKCAKILDEDVQFCPICKEEDPYWMGSPTELFDTLDNTAKQFKGETFDKLREINQQIEDRPPVIVENPPPWQETQELEDRPSAALYAFAIMLASCLSFAGLIMGIIYASRKNRHYRTLGIVTIVISLLFMLFSFAFSTLLIRMAAGI